MTFSTIPAASELVTVTVDGVGMQLPKGKNLLQALLDVGHYIPHYCYHPRLTVDGNCRLCLIEIEGRPKPEISCNMVVTDGLKINTASEMVEDCRQGMMEFLLVNHPLDCPVCDRGGECMLQRYSMEYGWGTARTSDERRRFQKPQFDPLIDIERNRCIMCTRCVRFCDEVAGEHVMGVFGHGSRNYIGTYGDGPVSNPFSGNVIDICPVGCLTSKPFRFKARSWELQQTTTTTRACNGPVTAWTRGGDLYRVTPPAHQYHGQYTINEDTLIFISNEARFGSLYGNSEERLATPLVRHDGEWIEASWDEALNSAAQALKSCEPGQSCFLAGERSTNEEFYLLSGLARAVCKTPHIDWRMRFTSEEAARAAGLALGAGDGSLERLDQGAYGATLMICAQDLLGSAPDIALHLKEAARNGRTKLGLLDVRVDDWFSQWAEAIFLEQPGQMVGTVERLARGLAAENRQAPEGYETLFNLLNGNEGGLVVLGLDAAGGALNPTIVPTVLNLMSALGEGWQFLPVTAARNAKGAFGCGGQSDRLPGGALADEKIRAAASDLHGGPIESTDQPAAAPELLRRAANGEFRALVLHRCDELTTHPQRELVEQALKNTPNVILIDIFPSWMMEYATIVLPGSVFYQNNGSMTDIDGTLQRMSQGSRPGGKAQEEWRILQSLAAKLGGGRHYRRVEDIFRDLCLAWGAPQAFRLGDLVLEGPSTLTPQENRSVITKRRRPSFKLNFAEQPAGVGEPGDVAHEDEGLKLVWIHHSQGPDHLSSRSSEFDALRPQPKIELHPKDAEAAGLDHGDWVVLEGGADSPSQVSLNPYLAEGVAYGAANVLGLRMGADEAGLPSITLKKTDAPAQQAQPTPEEVQTAP